ncbi:MAG: inorganic phosphate transporter [Thermoleophilia bacterium]|nr:inorganic phosphate transporter [Thermoleophilia bacterium]
MEESTLLLVAVVVVALFFDFTNGFHDAANAIATSVSTRAVSPRVAVLGAAVLNFAGAFVSLEVAATVAKGVVNAEVATLEVVLGGVVGAIVWNLITWYLGLPTSSSHALIGGVAGAAVVAAGWDVLLVGGLVDRVLIPSLAAPLIGIVGAFAIMTGLTWIIARRSPGTVNRVFRRLQIVSASFVAFTHGTNDAQKTMGIIALALVAAGHVPAGDGFYVPLWVIVAAATAMALGTYAGGWRIIRTLGQRVAKLEPPQGFAAETSCATILWFTGNIGFPVSTTHTISGSVLGAGATRRLSAVRWGVAGNIFVAWLLTIPAAGGVGALMELLARLPAGPALVIGVLLVFSTLAFAARRRASAAPTQGEALVSPPPAG